MLIRDCRMLIDQKRYTYCILNLCQAFEMYFALYLRVELLYKPFENENKHDIEHLNALSHILFDTIQKWTYLYLRNAFMNLIVEKKNYLSLSESESTVKNLNSFAKIPPSDESLQVIDDKKLSSTLLELKENDISTLRNKVVHKNGYRPTLEEVEKAEEDTSLILYRIESCLGMTNHHFYNYETNL